jgi:methoxymalonate biosynthesis acyl carrier protein
VHDVVASFVRSRFRSSLPGGALTHDQGLFSTGVVDSFGVLELIAFLEDAFRITIDTSRHDLAEFDSVNKIVELVRRIQQGA